MEVGLHVAMWTGKNNTDLSIVIVPLLGRQHPTPALSLCFPMCKTGIVTPSSLGCREDNIE